MTYNTRTTHFTNFGVSIQPRVADSCGFIHYRPGFEDRGPSTWTDGERWIDEQTRRIAAWRRT